MMGVKGWSVLEGGHGMFKGRQCTQCMVHLCIGEGPIDFRIMEIVQSLIATNLLTIIDQRHTPRRSYQYGQRITVFTIFLCQCFFFFVKVLVVVGQIDHTTKTDVALGSNQFVDIGFQGGSINTATTKSHQ